MGKRCCVFACDNDARYPEKVIKRGFANEMAWHGPGQTFEYLGANWVTRSRP